jgi:hypothetical protein
MSRSLLVHINGIFHPQSILDWYENDGDYEPDYSDLEFDSLTSFESTRQIYEHDHLDYEEEHRDTLRAMDSYYVTTSYAPEDELPYPLQCERPAMKSLHFPVCNTLHETTITEQSRYLGYVLIHAVG